MEISTSTWMMIAFIAGLILSIWKMYPFLVTRQLEDDDTKEEVQQELLSIVFDVIKEHGDDIDEKTLHKKVTQHHAFDNERFWRFNQNKLRQLLNLHYAKHPDTQSISDIHKKLNEGNAS
jgi:hypothetical protein